MTSIHQITYGAKLRRRIAMLESRIEKDLKSLESCRGKLQTLEKTGSLGPENLEKKKANLQEQMELIERMLDELAGRTV